jgi:hypothetical protein
MATMSLQKIFAQLSCSDLERSTGWFATVFARAPDELPMQHLAEWHHGSESGFQLFEQRENAGHGVLTLIVKDLQSEHQRLSIAGLTHNAIENADYVHLLRLRDPDGNLVVLAESKTPDAHPVGTAV